MTLAACPKCGHPVAIDPEPLTMRERDVLRAIVGLLRWLPEDKPALQIKEIAGAVQISPSNASGHVQALEDKGWIGVSDKGRRFTVLRRPPDDDDYLSPSYRRPKRPPPIREEGERRDCRQCGRPFMSAGPGDRICESCEDDPMWSSGGDYSCGKQP